MGVSAPFISPLLHVNGSRELVLLQESVQRGSFCSCLPFWGPLLSHTADLLLLLVLHLFVLFPAQCSLPSIPRTVRWGFQTCPSILPGRNGRASFLQRNWREFLSDIGRYFMSPIGVALLPFRAESASPETSMDDAQPLTASVPNDGAGGPGCLSSLGGRPSRVQDCPFVLCLSLP